MRRSSPSRRLPIDRGVDGPVQLFVDSGAWIALRSQRDQHHAAADHLFREALRRGLPLVTTPLVIAEVHRLTLFRVGVQAALRGCGGVGPELRTSEARLRFTPSGSW